MIAVGTSTLAMDGKNRLLMMPVVETHPSIQSMMVVTSPMGEKAPPELAARIIMLA